MSSPLAQPARALAGAAALTLSLLMGTYGFAQTATQPAQPAPAVAPAAALPEVSQPEPPASQLEAARAVVAASGMARSFDPMEPELEGQIVPLMTRTRPELVQDLKAVLAQLHPEFMKDSEEMTDIAAHIYARRMNEQELKDTAAFFSSAVGKKYVDIQPGMLDELVVAMQSWTQKLSTTMMLRVRQEMIKKGHPEF